MFKKLLAAILAILVIASILVACKSDGSTDPETPKDPDTPIIADDPDDPVESGTVFGEGAVLGAVKYYTKDVVVANIIATDAPYNADPTGKTDSTEAIQEALYDLDAQGGGVVFLPAGDYLVTRTIFVPSGCVLQGDWQDPDEVEAGKAEYGTVILAKPKALSADQLSDRATSPLILMDSYTGVVGLTFYYPEQNISQPIPYGYTIYSEAPRIVTLRDITMINSYRGVGVGTRLNASHELVQNESLHITALDTGVEMYRSTEVGFTVDLTVSPKYWIEAGRGWACDDAEALRAYCRENTLGLVLQKLDDECLSTLRFDACRTAIYAPAVEAEQADVWGTIYDVTVTDSMYGIVLEALNSSTGLVIADAEIEADKKAVVNSSSKGSLKLAGIELTGKGKICAEGGDIIYDETTDLSDYQIVYGSYQKPAPNLYNAEIGDLSGTLVDAAPAIQAVLDQAAVTGGVVYMPAGVYSLYTPITVPAGVQLRGAVPIFMRDAKGVEPEGTLLLTYITDEATVYLKDNAGVNGLRIFCPVYDALTAQETIENDEPETETCIAIKGIGKGVYAYNIGITGTMIGIDFTQCDDHLVKQTFGCTYNVFIRVGGKNGVVESCLSNPHFINRQSFAALGYLDENYCDLERQQAYSHGQNESTTAKSGFATLRDQVLRKYCTMIEVVDADHQTVSNIFMYAPYELVTVDHSIAFIYNTSADFVGFGSVYNVKNGSTVVGVNALRSVGDSARCDDNSYFDLYNRLNTEIYYEGDYHSSEGLEDTFDLKVKKKVSLFSEDQTANVGSAKLNTDKTYIKEGNYSYVHTPNGKTIENILQVNFKAVDITEYMSGNGYLHMWIYAEDMGTQTWGGSIELTSAGKEDTQEIYWIPTSFITHNGWNEVWLPLSDAKYQSSTGVAFNPQKVNFLRIFNTNNYFGNQGKFYIDDIYVCLAESDRIRLPIAQTTADEPTEPRPPVQAGYPGASQDELETVSVVDCDTIIYVSTTVPVQLNYDPNYVKEGSASWKSDAGSRANGEEIFCINIGKNGVLADISDYMKDGYLHFWLYIDGDYTFTRGSMEVTSSGTFDKQEINWNPVDFSDLEQGWNEIILPLDRANVADDFDPTKVNFMRLYIFTEGKTYGTYYIDDIYFAREKKDASEEDDESGSTDDKNNVTAEGDLIVSNCDSLRPAVVTTTLKVTNDAQYVKEGTGAWYHGKGTPVFDIAFIEPIDVSAYANGYLHMWVWISDCSNINQSQFEITSSGTYDKNERYWGGTGYLTKNGWNEVWLPLAQAGKCGGDADLTKINYIRLYVVPSSGTNTFYIDDIYFTNNK